MNGTREFETPPLCHFVWPAVLLHAAFVGVVSLAPARLGDAPSAPVARAQNTAAEVEVDLQLLAVSRASKQRGAQRAARAESGAPASNGAPLARLLRAPFRRGSEGPTPASVVGESVGADAVDGAEGSSLVPPGGEEGTEAGRALSLEQLGVTLEGSASALQSHRHAPLRRPSARRRLQRSMASATEARDRARGLGAHGKVIKALEVAARAETTPANGRADFLVVVDEHGQVASVEVVGATGKYRAWKRAAQRARRALARFRFPLPEGAQGLQMHLEIASRVQRPSGADPGVEVSLFGIPLNRVKGERPSKIEILNPIPKLHWVEVPDAATGETRELPVVQLGIVPLMLGFDPADLGAPTRRVVSGRVVDVNVL